MARLQARHRQVAKSVRLSIEELQRLEQAARVLGVKASALMRDAIAQRCEVILADDWRARLEDVIGVVNVPVSVRQRGEAFQDALLDRATRRRPLS